MTAATDEDTTEAAAEVVEGEAEEVDPTMVPPVGGCISTSAINRWGELHIPIFKVGNKLGKICVYKLPRFVSLPAH